MAFLIALWQFFMEFGVYILGAGLIFLLIIFFIWRGLVELRIFFRI